MLRLALRVRREHAELALAELIELAPSGVEEVDVSEEVVEYAVYGAPGELPLLPDLEAAAGGALVEVRTTEVADDWSERWREFHRPLVLDGRLCVRPPWEAPRPDLALDLVIDPGRAFGTGAHPTTRLCLELLLELEPSSATDQEHATVDLGCGSGVLAIAAARLGWQPVLALDLDPVAVEVTTDNARVNGVEGRVRARRFDLRAHRVPAAGLVLANLLRPLLLAWAGGLAAADAGVPGQVIASGLLEGEGDEVARAFAVGGLTERTRRVSDGWLALLLSSEGS